MAASPEPDNLTGLTLFIDTHIIDATDEAPVRLRRLHTEGWIELRRTDVMDTELANAPADKRSPLNEASAVYEEELGPGVWGNSRWGHAVWASDDDAARLDDAYTILFPKANRATATHNHLRDAMHVASAIRSGAFGFITRDRRVLSKSERIAERFRGFRLWTPEQGLDEVLARIRSLRELHSREPHHGTLPCWPTEGDLR